jgi:putative endonuclease
MEDSYPPRRTAVQVCSPVQVKVLIVQDLFMLYTVYILYSEKSNKHYTGFTSDLKARLLSHNELGKEWTASYRPWKIIYTKEFLTKQEATAHEKWLKSGAGRDFVKSLPH